MSIEQLTYKDWYERGVTLFGEDFMNWVFAFNADRNPALVAKVLAIIEAEFSTGTQRPDGSIAHRSKSPEEKPN